MIGIAPSHRNQLGNYTSWMEKRGLPYKLLKPNESLEGCSMLLLCGGPDIGTSPERDEQEARWFKEAYGKIHILGICRGLQLSNVMLGGTLHSDLNEDAVKHTPNKVEIAGEPQPLMESSWHDIEFEDGRRFKVNSRHHQGICEMAPGLKSIAVCTDDKLVEMAEGDKALFVQWHPERPDVWGTEAESVIYEWIAERIDTSVKTSPAPKNPVQMILEYMTEKGFTVISNERVRKSIDPSLDDRAISKLLIENSTRIRKSKDKHGRIAIRRI
jgi:GMP synthase-like glutamine amidotransferase